MKPILVLLISISFLSCKNVSKDVKPPIVETEQKKVPPTLEYPEDFIEVMNAHGSLEKWKTFNTLNFGIKKGETTEEHTVDLYSRKDKIDMAGVEMGFDGKEVWLMDEASSYKGDPLFYHNLMFYFYAMPFVFADKGINYTTTEDLVFEEIHYPGIKMSFESNIGVSPKDEYFLHYNPDTHQMEWLGYTVTYRSGEKSDNVKWIRYNDWMPVSGVKLPKSITWHAYEGRTIKKPTSTVVFENVTLSQAPKPNSFYARPENAKVVTKP